MKKGVGAKILLMLSCICLASPMFATGRLGDADNEAYQGRLNDLQQVASQRLAVVAGLERKGAAEAQPAASATKSQLTKVNLVLQQITGHVTTEKRGDEVYFDILEYGDNRTPRHYHVPKKPHYWPSAILSKIKDQSLWQGAVSDGNNVKLIVSLMEKDVPPWNNNDLIGVFKLEIKSENGELRFFYSLMEPKAKVENSAAVFRKNINMTGNDGQYEIKLLAQ